MTQFNVHVSINKSQTMLFATIRKDNNEIVKEFVENIGSLGPKFHQKILNRICIDWINYDYQEPIVPSITEATSGSI